MTAQQYYWYKINQQRASAYARLMRAQAIARKLAPYVAGGGDPSHDPEYCWLIDEFGEKFFTDELEKFMLEKEEDKHQ